MFAELKLYAVCFVSIILVDFIWIGFVAKKFYIEQLRPIGRIAGESFQPVLWAAGLVYVVLAIAIVQFALPKIPTDATWLACFGVGALLGFVIYATYDLTNYATLKDYTLAMTFADIAWGAIVGGIVTCVARYVREM